jgi:predicted AAA+ superfamily ATPase
MSQNPPPVILDEIQYAPELFHYIKRDIRSIRNIGNLADFQRFLLALAAQTAQLLNISALSRVCTSRREFKDFFLAQRRQRLTRDITVVPFALQ